MTAGGRDPRAVPGGRDPRAVPGAGTEGTTRRALLAGGAGLGLAAAGRVLPARAGRGSSSSLPREAACTVAPGELAVPRVILTQFQPGHEFVLTDAARASSTDDQTPGNYICGTQAVTVVTRGGGYADLTGRGLSFDAAGRYLAVRYRVSAALGVRELMLDVSSDAAFAARYSWQFADNVRTLGAGFSYDGAWAQVFLSFADAAVTGAPDRSRLTAARLRVKDGGTPVTVQWQEISLVSEPVAEFPAGVATICFDDLYASQYARARPVLEARGYPATLAVIAQLVGTPHGMSLAQLRSLQDDQGWEIGCHADSLAVHRATDVACPASVVGADLDREQRYLRGNGLTGYQTFAYPSGLWDPDVLGLVSGTCRSARLDFFGTQETFPPANACKLRACGSISSMPGAHSPADVMGYIDAAAANRSWLILIFHKFVTGTPRLMTECSVTDFAAIIAHLAASGMAVATTGDVLRRWRR